MVVWLFALHGEVEGNEMELVFQTLLDLDIRCFTF